METTADGVVAIRTIGSSTSGLDHTVSSGGCPPELAARVPAAGPGLAGGERSLL
jgi:hypothetical protein